MADGRTPLLGELWRVTRTIPMPAAIPEVPAGTLLLVVGRAIERGSCESRVVWDGGTGWVSDWCTFWEPVDESR